MSTGVPSFDTTIQQTNLWLEDLVDRLDVHSRQQAYAGLRATLHALRDRLPPNMTLALSAQLPMLLRGLFLEGWRLAEPPTGERSIEGFSDHVDAELPAAYPHTGEETARIVFQVISERVGEGLAEKLATHLPQPLRELWPEAPVSYVTGDWL